MSYSEKGIKLDLQGDYLNAIKQYQLVIEFEDADISIYLNLATLLFLAASSFSWADLNNISIDFRTEAVDEYSRVLKKAKLRYPDCAEIYFLQKYFNHRLIFDPLEEAEVLEILKKYEKCNITLYFFLYLIDGNKYLKERNKILEECNKLPTGKNLYIKSLIEN